MKFTLEQAKARNADILTKVQAVESKAQTKKRDVWLQQQKLQWIDSWRRLKSSPTLALEDDVWGQVNGARDFFRVFLARAQDTAKRNALREVLDGVSTVVHLTLVELQHEEEQLEAELLEANQLSEDMDVMYENLSDDEEDLVDEMTLGKAEYCTDLQNVLAGYRETRVQLLGDCEESKAQFQKVTQSLPVRDTLSTPSVIVRTLGPIAGVSSLQWVWPRGKKDMLLNCLRSYDRMKFAEEALRAHGTSWRQQRFDLYECTRDKYQHAVALEELQSLKILEDEKHLQTECKTKGRLAELRQEQMQKEEQSVLAGRKAREVDFDRVFAQREKTLGKKKHAESIKEQSLAFMGQKLALKELEDEETRVKREFEEKTRHICGKYNALRVSARRSVARWKKEEREGRRLCKEEQEREAALRLEQALERLKPNVACDRSRLLLPLEKDAHAMHRKVSPIRGPLAGFTVDQLMKDARYKLSSALFSAGLHETEAGRLTLIQTKSAFVPRRDTMAFHEQHQMAG